MGDGQPPDQRAVERRRLGWWLAAGGVFLSLLVGAAALLWWKLPEWKPEWVARHAPFIEPAVRAAARHYEAMRLLHERLDLGLYGDPIPGLLRVAGSGDEPEKELAITLLGRFGDRRAAGPVLEALGTDAYLSRNALEFIERVRPPEAAVGLQRFCQEYLPSSDQDEAFWRACTMLLLDYRDTDAIAYVLRAIEKGGDAIIRPQFDGARGFQPAGRIENAVIPARFVNHAPRHHLIAGLRSPHPPVVVALLEGLAYADHQTLIQRFDLVPDLLPFLDHDDPRAASAAITMIAEALGEGAIPALWRLRRHATPVIGSHATIALHTVLSPAVLPYLVQDWSSLTVGDRTTFTDSLVQLRDPIAIALLHRACNDPDGLVGRRACAWLLDQPAIIDRVSILACLRTGTLSGQAQSLTICGRLGWRDSADDVLRLLASPEPEVARAAVLAAGHLRLTSAILPVAGMLQGDGDELLATTCLTTLGLIGHPSVDQVLVEHTRSSDAEHAALALAALENLIAGGLDPAVHQAAAQAVSTRHGAEVVEEARGWFRDELALCPLP